MLYRAIVAALLFVTADGSRLPGSGSITLTSEMKLDDQGMRASILPFSASWSAPIKKIGQLTLMGDTSKGKESFAREVRLNGVAAKTSAGTALKRRCAHPFDFIAARGAKGYCD